MVRLATTKSLRHEYTNQSCAVHMNFRFTLEPDECLGFMTNDHQHHLRELFNCAVIFFLRGVQFEGKK